MTTWVDILGVVSAIMGLIIAIPTIHYLARTLYNRFSYVRHVAAVVGRTGLPASFDRHAKYPASAKRLFKIFARYSICRMPWWSDTGFLSIFG
jgi:hypothetical protein